MKHWIQKCMVLWLLCLVVGVAPVWGADVLKVGMKGSQVKQVQQWLIQKGYYDKKPNGIFDEALKEAVMAFQYDYQLDADGIVGKETRAALKEKVVRKKQQGRDFSARHEQTGKKESYKVSTLELQGYLLLSGYVLPTYDGIYGQDTKRAVMEFQRRNGMKATGIVDEKTYRALRVIPGAPTSYKKKLKMHTTAYTSQDEGNGLYTARGNRLTQGLVAVDPNVIPLGSVLYIEGYGYAIADDTGGAIVGNTVDIGMPSQEEALQWGRKDVMVYIVR